MSIAHVDRVVRLYPNTTKQAALEAEAAKQLVVYSILVHNRAGSSNDLGIAKKLGPTTLKIHKKATATYTDITSSVQAGAANTVFAANNDAVFFGAKTKAGLFGINVSTGEAGSPVYTYEYWNGSSWTTLTVVESQTAYGTGSKLLVFAPPVDWSKGGDTGEGLSTSHYYVKVTATTAPTSGIALNDFWAGQMMALREGVADTGTLEISAVDAHRPLVFDSGEGVLPYFKSPNANNLVEVTYSTI